MAYWETSRKNYDGNKRTKRALVITLSVLIALVAALAAAVGIFLLLTKDSRTAQGVDYNSFISYSISYTDDEECPSGNIVDEYLQESRSFATGEENYAVIDFSLYKPRNNGWKRADKFTASSL